MLTVEVLLLGVLAGMMNPYFVSYDIQISSQGKGTGNEVSAASQLVTILNMCVSRSIAGYLTIY